MRNGIRSTAAFTGLLLLPAMVLGAVAITIVPPSGMGELPAGSDTRRIAERLLGEQVQFRQDAAVGFYFFSAPGWNGQVDEPDRAKLIQSLRDYWGKDRVKVEQRDEPSPRARIEKLFAIVSVEPLAGPNANILFDGRAGARQEDKGAVAVRVQPPSGPYSPQMLQAAATESKVAGSDLQALIRTKQEFYRRLDSANLMGLFDRASLRKAAKALGLDAGARGEKLAALVKDPAANIRLGAWLWADLVSRFQGNKDRALLAWYIGGPAFTPAWRSIAQYPEMRAALAAFHRFQDPNAEIPPQIEPKPVVKKTPPALKPAEKRPETTPIIPTPPLKPALPVPSPLLGGEPARPSGRYWSEAEVETWIRYHNEREFHWSDDFLKFIKAMIFTESPYTVGNTLYADSEAKSPTGAKGIAQFIWDTAKFYGLVEAARDPRGRPYYIDHRNDGVMSLHACMRYVNDLVRSNRRADYLTLMHRVANGYNVGEGEFYVRAVQARYCSFGGMAGCVARNVEKRRAPR